MRGLGNVELRQAVWERQYWKGADVEGDQKLDFDNVERLCKRLNVNSPTGELTRLFKVSLVFINRTIETFTDICCRIGSRHSASQLSRFRRLPGIRQTTEKASGTSHVVWKTLLC